MLYVLSVDNSSKERFFNIEQHDPGPEQLISPNAEHHLLGDRYGLTEGPMLRDSDDGGFL